jgi:hypothetical protein
MAGHAHRGTVAERCLDPPDQGKTKAQQRRSGLMIHTHVLHRDAKRARGPPGSLSANGCRTRNPKKTLRIRTIVRNPLVIEGPGEDDARILCQPGGRRRVL